MKQTRIALTEGERKRLDEAVEGVELGTEIRDTIIGFKDQILSALQGRLESNDEVDEETLEQIKKNVEENFMQFVDDSEDSLYTMMD